MIREVVASGKDISEAKENARAALNAGELDDVQFEIIELGSKGIFGVIGVKPAKVRAFIETPDAGKTERPARGNRPAKENRPAKDSHPAKEGRSEKSDKKPAPRAPKAEKKIPDFEIPAEESKPKSAVIPETELVFEKKEVADGEDMSYEFVKTLLVDIGIQATAELLSCSDGTRRINIVGEDASALIGHHGDTLDAIQYLANLASAQKNVNGERDKSRVTIDIEGYRAKREATLRALARRMAAKALRQKRSIMLEPMTAYERRIIHSEVQSIEGVSTNSIGADNNRKIVIYLTDKKPENVFEEEDAPMTSLKKEFGALEDESSVNGIVRASASVDGSDEEIVAMEKTVPAEDLIEDDADLK